MNYGWRLRQLLVRKPFELGSKIMQPISAVATDPTSDTPSRALEWSQNEAHRRTGRRRHHLGIPDSMTARPAPEEMTVRLRKAMDLAVGLSPDNINNVQSLIDVGEWLVAFETLCTQIYEWEIRLDPMVVRDLEGLGLALGARAKLTDQLWEGVGIEDQPRPDTLE